jgi:hypothetical protein
MNPYTQVVLTFVTAAALSLGPTKAKAKDSETNSAGVEQKPSVTSFATHRMKETPLIQKNAFDKPIKLKLEVVPLINSERAREVSFEWRK